MTQGLLMPPTESPPLEVVVLAAGKGTRMRSSLPKVLHPIGGLPMLHHVLNKAQALQASTVHVVVGHQADTVRDQTELPVNWVVQEQQRGTGHAVMQVAPHIADDSVVLVLYGDVPLVSEDTLTRAVIAARDGRVGLVTAEFADPAALGRIVRDAQNNVCAIVEHADASPEQRAIREINSGILALPATHLKALLARIKDNNSQGEYYLTDVIALAVAAGLAVEAVSAARPEEVTGVNDRVQLAQLERLYQLELATALQRAGATLADPARVDIRGSVTTAEDVFIDFNVLFEGTVILESGASIGPNTVIRDSRIGAGARVEANSTVDGAELGARSSVGPFARIRPGSVLGECVKVGNFVETKQAQLGPNSKASHLSYLGDVTIGADCNVGAGTVTCNFDGVTKHRTQIGDDVFVGTNSTLVAPLTLGSGSFVAAGSTITGNIAAGELGVGRGKQRNIQGWTRPDKRQREK